MTEFEKWKKELTLEDVAMDIKKAAATRLDIKH